MTLLKVLIGLWCAGLITTMLWILLCVICQGAGSVQQQMERVQP